MTGLPGRGPRDGVHGQDVVSGDHVRVQADAQGAPAQRGGA
ncbi:hypothetical protein [Streptomyces yatensis]|nr:hypothetical protein [Streptomyces yatensis]